LVRSHGAEPLRVSSGLVCPLDQLLRGIESALEQRQRRLHLGGAPEVGRRPQVLTVLDQSAQRPLRALDVPCRKQRAQEVEMSGERPLELADPLGDADHLERRPRESLHRVGVGGEDALGAERVRQGPRIVESPGHLHGLLAHRQRAIAVGLVAHRAR
jgi:hypothetical protein